MTRKGQEVAILCFGTLHQQALIAAEKLNASVANMRFVKPLDTTLIAELSATHKLLVTLEENAVMGGAGSAVNEWLLAEGINTPVLNLGLPDIFVEHAKPAQMLAECGLDAEGIEAAIRRRLSIIPEPDQGLDPPTLKP
jgi:1-deoxy-D-xylulose-5-phosphate synthase